MDKPYEFWAALGAATAYVLHRSEARSFGGRVVEAAISGALGFSLAPELADWLGRSETLAVAVITAFVYAALDVLTSLVIDREAVREIIKSRIGGGK